MSRLVDLLNEKNNSKMEYNFKDITIALEKYASLIEYGKNGEPTAASVKEVASKIKKSNADIFYAVPANLAKLQKSSKSEGFAALLIAINDSSTYEDKNMGVSVDDRESVQLTVKTSGADIIKIKTLLALQKPNKNGNGKDGIIFADGESDLESVTVSSKTKFKITTLTVEEIISEIEDEDTGVVGFKIADKDYIFGKATVSEIKDAINADQDSFEAKEQTIEVKSFGVNVFKIKLNLELI